MDADRASRVERQIEWILQIRRARTRILGDGLFSDPAWDILLELFGARLAGRKIGLTDLACDAPPSTLARWAGVLEERGLIVCELDSLVPSALRYELSELGAARMAEVLDSLRHLHPTA